MMGKDWSWRIARALAFPLFLALIIPVMTSTESRAQSRVCASLQAQLASLSRPTGKRNTRQYRKFDRALRKQASQLTRAKRAHRRNGCSLQLFFNSRKAAICQKIERDMSQMRRNMRALGARRDSFSGQYSGKSPKRKAIERAMRRNRCFARQARRLSAGEQDARRINPFRRKRKGSQFFILPGLTRNQQTAALPSEDELIEGDRMPMGRGFRTLCVRTCDGYYFPISFATSSSRFAADEMICQSQCPGAETKLYVHRNPGQESEDMKDLNGAPYKRLPNAFAYRKSFNPSCSCRSATRQRFTIVGQSGVSQKPLPQSTPLATAETPVAEGPSLPMPQPRPDPFEDPETLALTVGQLDPTQPMVQNTARITTRGGRKVRLVGPAYSYLR